MSPLGTHLSRTTHHQSVLLFDQVGHRSPPPRFGPGASWTGSPDPLLREPGCSKGSACPLMPQPHQESHAEGCQSSYPTYPGRPGTLAKQSSAAVAGGQQEACLFSSSKGWFRDGVRIAIRALCLPPPAAPHPKLPRKPQQHTSGLAPVMQPQVWDLLALMTIGGHRHKPGRRRRHGASSGPYRLRGRHARQAGDGPATGPSGGIAKGGLRNARRDFLPDPGAATSRLRDGPSTPARTSPAAAC